jgi:hypothetical protein
MAESSFLALSLALVALAGCSGIDHVQLDGVTNMPDDSTLTLQGGSLHTGIATAFTPRVWTHDLTDTDEEDRSSIDVQSSDTRVLGVANVTNDGRVVVFAAAPGQATLTITLDGETAQAVPVTVTDPSP